MTDSKKWNLIVMFAAVVLQGNLLWNTIRLAELQSQINAVEWKAEHCFREETKRHTLEMLQKHYQQQDAESEEGGPVA